jgi:hypothetical protein
MARSIWMLLGNTSRPVNSGVMRQRKLLEKGSTMHRLQSSMWPVWLTLRLIPSLTVIFTSFLVVPSQTPSGSQAEEVRKLHFLLGEWKGTGWQVHWDGSRGDEFSQKTKVEARAGGSAMRIKDARKYKTPGASHSSTLDATISYHEGAKMYLWNGDTSYGREHPLAAYLVDARTFQYGVPLTVTGPLPNGARRTTIKVSESGEWNEIIDVWKTDRWYKVEESILMKVK